MTEQLQKSNSRLLTRRSRQKFHFYLLVFESLPYPFPAVFWLLFPADELLSYENDDRALDSRASSSSFVSNLNPLFSRRAFVSLACRFKAAVSADLSLPPTSLSYAEAAGGRRPTKPPPQEGQEHAAPCPCSCCCALEQSPQVHPDA